MKKGCLLVSKIKKIILIVLTLAIVVSVIPETHVFSLQDRSVENNAFLYQTNYQNQNQPIKQMSTSSRVSLLHEGDKTVLYEELEEYGYLEEKNKRTEDSKTFMQGDEKKTYIFGEPIHYIKNGEFVEYDNTIQKLKTRSTNAYYQTISNDHTIMIPSTFNSAIKVDALSFTIDEDIQDGVVKQDSIIYQGNKEDKDYRIQATSQGVKVTSAISNENSALTQRYTVTLASGYTMKATDDKKAAIIFHGEDVYASFSSVDIKDADGNIVEDGAEITVQSLPNATYIVTVTPTQETLGILRSLPYENITSITRTTNRDHNLIKAYGVRSGSSFAHRSYAPEVNSSYSHFALTGRDPSGSINEGVASPENVALVQVDFNTIKNNYIGSDRRIDDASIHFRVITSVGNTSNLSISRLSENMSLFGNYGGMTWNNYNYYFQRYQNRNETYSPVRQDFKQVTKIPGQELWVGFDISEATSHWNDGNPAYGFIIEGDSADTTAQALANHSNINGADRLPYMVITHTPNGPVNKNEPLTNTTLNVRPFTQSNRDGMLHFTALGFDGVSRPNSEVQIQVVDTSNNSIVYDNKSKVNSDWRIFPAYDPITNCQRYYRKTSNYQCNTLLLSKNLKADCLYQIRYKVTAYDKDGKATETQEFKNSDTFQVYKVKAYDRLTRIIEFYGITNQSQFRLDNNIYDSLLFQGNQIIIRNPTKNKNQAYSKTEYSMDDKKAIDAALMGRGFHCEFGYEPINFNTGNLYYSNEDSSFVEYGQTYTIERSYNSLSNRTGLFGKQWDFNWDFQLALLDNAIMFSDGTGKLITFFKDSSGKYSAFNHVNMTLTKQKIGEKEIMVDSGYYDQEQTPIQTVEKIPIYQFVLKDNDTGRTYVFDEELFIKEVILDVYNHKVSYSYDNNRNVTKMKFSSGKEFTFTYNALHCLTKITYPNGTTTKYEYDNEGHLITFIDQLGNKLEYKYNSKGLLDSYVSREDKKVLVKNSYDNQGRVIKQTNGANETVSLEYKIDRTIVTDYKGNKKTIYLDENKRTKKIDDTKDTILKTYDSKNHLISEQSSNDKSVSTQYVYNDKNQITSQIRHDGKKKQYFYNTAGNVIKTIDFNGDITTFSYDGYGNMTNCVYPDGSTETMQYNNDGQQTYSKDVYGRQTYSMY